MNEKLNNAVLDAVKDMFKTMLSEEIQSGNIVEKNIDEPKFEVNVVISFVGKITGAITLKGSKKLAKDITSKMLGFEVEDESDDIKDAVGEFLNIIMGAIKRNYSEDNAFDISVPTVVIGSDYVIYTKAERSDKVSIIDFIFKENKFIVEIYQK